MPETSVARRAVQYKTLSEVVRDAEQLLPSHHTVGKWTFGQICQHLAKAMNATIDGFGFQAPWWARWFIAPLLKNSLLTKPMKPGFNLPSRAASLFPDEHISAEEGLSQLKAAVDRLAHERPTAPHPFLGKMASEEVMQLQLRHCEMHMSFIQPGSRGESPK